MKEKIGFIGMGNMASAMLKGMMTAIPKEQIVFSRKNREKGSAFAEEQDIVFIESNQECAKHVK